ncbi:MAG TPA: fibronectin type III domain-containing protein [Candidatus Polarisedimenticolia bacterium]|nr:fibronectin type III domain-containing protein [Candidatus Polarisedimenticolia bacterium]
MVAGLFACGVAKGDSTVSVQWTPNSDPSVIGYNVYYGGASRVYTNMLVAGNTNATVSGLVAGKTYFFAVTAFDAFGDESDFSDESIFLVPGFLTVMPGAKPGDPTRIEFPVAQNHWYELQASSDLISWTTIWQVTGVVNTWVQFDAPVSGSGSQFYRVVLH